MINITIPNNNLNERKYILDIIFNNFLGFNFNIKIGSEDYKIILPNNKELIIKDTFFNKYPNDLEYLKEENIPKSIKELDIFAASFFMLTRWEEYVNKNRDKHNRFPAYASLAYKEGFLDRPIVNEYVEILKNILFELDDTLVFKKHKYQMIATHDVDLLLKYPSITSGLKEIVGDIVKRKNFKLALSHIVQKTSVHCNLQKDPYDNFDYLMDISEKNGVSSYFFFMGRGITGYDNMYSSDDKFLTELVKKIKRRGHYIGMHPSYNAYNNFEQFVKEKEELEKNLDTKITFGREHYLRFEIPATWQIWEDNGMAWDSTLSYADKEGFRCGVCYDFRVFNILTQKKLNLIEKPLIAMEVSLVSYQQSALPQEMEKKIKNLIQKVKKYNGNFIFLWHNSSFHTPEWEKYNSIYERILKNEKK